MINVTETFLPDLFIYNKYLRQLWESKWLTNRGKFVLQLEDELKSYLSVNRILIMNNGTVPIQIALKLLAEQGEVITTPFSYVATSAAIIWENCSPVFVDIHPEYLTIDENKIEQAITPRTTAILATHVFGNPCNIEVIEAIAKKHNLSVIYDAAHCFGVKYKGRSVFNFGDVSTCSFHATKLFHTGEGGAVFCNDEDLFAKIFYSHNFGHNGSLDFHGLGINGKISELQAAMGLSVLPSMEYIINDRKRVVDFYNNTLDFSRFSKMRIRENTEWNYSYFAVIFDSEENLLLVQKKLNDNSIVPRRYFYPSLNTINYIKGEPMPISESISSRVLCLPLYVGLGEDSLSIICNIVNNG